nr:putative ribonuclease H-like domain-containing protein [Tanacetum cinerariifolium]
NQPNDNAGIKENLNASKVRKETISAQQYVLLPLWSTGLQDPHNTDDDVADAAFDVKENENDVHVSTNESNKTDNKKHDEKAKRDDKGKSLVDSCTGVSDLRAEFEEFSFNSSNRMYVKSAFLYGTIKEEVYVCQPPGFKDFDYPDKKLCTAFEKLMKEKFQMSSMGELTFFLGLQVKKKDDGIFINQDKYVPKILRKFSFTDVKSASTPIETEKPLLRDPDGEDVDVHIYRIETIRLFLAYASFMRFMVYQMDVKSALLYGTIEEEVYVCQPPRFEDPDYPDKVYKVVKALYGLHQAPRAAQVGDLSSHSTKYSSPALTKKMFANMRRVGKGFFGVDTPLFEDDDVVDEGATSVAVDDVPATVDEPYIPSPTPTTQPPPPSQGLPSTSQDKIAQTLEITKLKQRVKKLERRNKLKEDADEDVTLKDVAAVEKDAEIEENADDDEIEPAKLKEVVEVVTTAKLMAKVVTTASATITAATTPIHASTITAAPSAARRRKGVVIKDLEETTTPSIIIHSKPKSKDNGKGIMVEEPKPLKKQAQIEQDNVVMRYQVLRRKPQTKAQDRKNMMIYLRNMAGFKMDYFKGMSYDDIRLIFKKKFNSNIVPNDEDDVYTEATPLARKVPVIDYEIYTENNKPYYKIIRADGSSQLFLSFLSILRNFDKEDLEVLWQLVKEIFASSKPKNFSDDFLLTTLTYMFEKPDVQAQECSWIRKCQKLETVRVLWSTHYNIYNYTDDLAGREKISTNKICKAITARRIQTRIVFGYILH